MPIHGGLRVRAERIIEDNVRFHGVRALSARVDCTVPTVLQVMQV